MKKIVIRFLILAVLGALAYGGYTAFKQIPQKQQSLIATAKVKQGEVVVRAFARGELRAVRSATLSAPNLFGTVQVTKLAALGAFAKEKDLVVEFDDSEVLSRIEEKQLELDQLDEQIKKSMADLAIRANQDEVDLLKARFAVRRAELEVKRNELLSAIDAKKNDLSFEEAKRRLKQLENDIKSRREQAEAELAVLREKKSKANIEMSRERARLNQVKLLSPISGLVAIKPNRGTGFMMFGQQLPDIREGDQVQPGMQVADVLDLSELEVIARIGELDRANLREGQDVNITLDALAEKHLNGKIKSMSGTASANVFSSDPAKKFDVLFSVDMQQLLKALGASQDQINRVLAAAESNRKKPPIPSAPFMMGGGMAPAGGGPGGGQGGGQGGGMPGGGGPGPGGPPTMEIRPGGPGGFPGGGAPGAGGPGGRGGGGGGGMFASLPPDQQKKAREIMQKVLDGRRMQELKPEERPQVMKKMADEMKKAGINLPPGFGAPPSASGRFTQKDIDSAQLPPPPEESNSLDVLLRPGMLADVEIIVEKIPNAIHVPAQAVFVKDGSYVVYVKQGQKLNLRPVKVLKRSENVMIISEGLKPGEDVALQDPTAAPSQKKKGGAAEKEPGGGAMMPTGKKG